MAKLQIDPISNWFNVKHHPLLIAGPCSAESEIQMVTTAKELAKTGYVTALRAGIWKPRTRPGAFEGIGEVGLSWLIKAREATGLPVGTEVANAKHVELCLKAGLDFLWMGARTTVSPFSVQEIADALRGVDIPIIIKNPVNPDLALWIGAFERMNAVGIKRIAAIHRGFTTYEKSSFRNAPMWEIALELKRQFPDLPIICDPSHICGNRELIPFISQKAMDMNLDGLIIETHITPDAALSDAQQQITPRVLKDIIDSLVVRTENTNSSESQNKLSHLRTEINKIDEDLIQKLSLRMKISEKIGHLKKADNVTVYQRTRWDELFKDRIKLGEALGMSEEFMAKLLMSIHEESIRIQEDIMNEKK